MLHADLTVYQLQTQILNILVPTPSTVVNTVV